MKATVIAVCALLVVAAYAGDPLEDTLEQQAAFYANFGDSLNPEQRAKLDAIYKKLEKHRTEKLKRKAIELAVEYEALTGLRIVPDANDPERLKAQVDVMSKAIAEHRQKLMLKEAAEFNVRRDAENAEWFAEQQRKRKLNQLQFDKQQAEQELRKLQRGR